MADTNDIVSLETANHVIEVSGGCLSICTKTFPDVCVSLTQEETEKVLKLLLIGAHAIVLRVTLPGKDDKTESSPG